MSGWLSLGPEIVGKRQQKICPHPTLWSEAQYSSPGVWPVFKASVQGDCSTSQNTHLHYSASLVPSTMSEQSPTDPLDAWPRGCQADC